MHPAPLLARRILSLPMLGAILCACVAETPPSDSDVPAAEEEPEAEPAQPPEPRPVVPPTMFQAITVEPLGPAEAAAPIDQTRRMQSVQGSFILTDDAWPDETTDLGQGTQIDATWTESGLLIALDGVLYDLSDDGVAPSVLNDVIPMAAQTVVNDGQALWILGEGRVVQVEEQFAVEVRITSDEFTAFAASGSGLAYVGAPDLWRVNMRTLQVETFAALDGRSIRSLSVNADGRVFAADEDGALWVQDRAGTWAWLAFPEPVTAVAGDPLAEVTWIRAGSDTFVESDGQFWSTDAPVGTWSGVDELGRLLIVQEDELVRASVGAPVAFAGLRPYDSVTLPVQVKPVLTAPDDAETVTVWMDGIPLDLNDEGTVTIEPLLLPDGVHDLRVARASNGRVSFSTIPFRTGDLPPATWYDDIEPIARRNCFECHTVGMPQLTTAWQWQSNIDDIIDQTTAGTMPPGENTPLTPEELLLIRRWQSAEFP